MLYIVTSEGPVPITDMQTNILSSPSKMAIFTWNMRNVLKRMKNQFGDF